MNQLSPFYERNYICPVCQMSFKSLALRTSAIYVEKRESDFHSVYRGLNPLHYSIIVCPVCKYAASQQSFANELSAAMVKQLGSALARLDARNKEFTKERDMDTVLESFQLAIRTAQLKKSRPGELAGLLHAAAWICREENNEEMEKTYLDQARNYYRQGFEKSSSNIGNLTDVQVAFLIGDLSLRLGNYTEAINWFNKTISHPKIKLNPNIEKQAREQWGVARDLSKSQNSNPAESSSAKSDVSQPVSETNQTQADSEHPGKKNPVLSQHRSSMQMMTNLYSDQIDWLNQIMNRGYDSSKKLVTREQVLRSLLDACREHLDGKIPEEFSSEAELKSRWLELL